MSEHNENRPAQRSFIVRCVESAAFHFIGDAGFSAGIVAVAYSLIFHGPWIIAMWSGATWFISYFSLIARRLYLQWRIRVLRRELERLGEQAQRMRAERLRVRALILQYQAHVAQLETLSSAQQVEVSQLRTELYERERLRIQQEAQQERRLTAKREVDAAIRQNEIKASQLEIIANQLEIRAGQLEVRLEQSLLWQLLKTAQDEFEQKARDAYAAGFRAGRQGQIPVARAERHLRVVDSSA